MEVRSLLQLLVRDRQLETVAEHPELLLGELLRLVGDVARLDPRPERPALDGLGEDDRRGTPVLGRGLVRRVHLPVVVAAPAELRQVLVGEVLDELAEPRVGAEEVFPDVRPAGDRILLVLPVEGVVHLLDQDAVDVAGEELVPLTPPDDLDDVPAGAPEEPLQLLDDLAVAADRAVEALEVAVHDEHEVVEALSGGEREARDRLRLVHLPVADEAPDSLLGRVTQAPVLEVPVEASLVDRSQRPEAHRDGRELPEVGHQPGVRVGRQAAPTDFPAEPLEVLLGQPSFQERPGVDARRGVTLEEDLVAAAGMVLAPEEPVEADLVEGRRRGVRREVAADPRIAVVRPEDHRDGVPADQPPDPSLELLVAREIRLLLRADRVDVPGLGERRQTDVELTGPLEELEHEEPGPVLALVPNDLVEGVEPLLGLLRVDVGQLVLELVEVHGWLRWPGRSIPSGGRRRPIAGARSGDRSTCRTPAYPNRSPSRSRAADPIVDMRIR
jgi:hypothetical protein